MTTAEVGKGVPGRGNSLCEGLEAMMACWASLAMLCGSDPSPSPLSPPSPVDRQGDVALPPYYQPEEDDEMPFICSLSGDNGIMGCHEIPPLKEQGRECCLSKDDVYDFGAGRQDLNASGLCVNWNRYYNVCRTGSANPHKGAINFDNIGYAWIVIFQVGPSGLALAPVLGGVSSFTWQAGLCAGGLPPVSLKSAHPAGTTGAISPRQSS